MGQSVDAALIAALSRFDAALEVGIGRRTTAAAQLVAAGTTVVAIDVDSDAVGEVGSDGVGEVGSDAVGEVGSDAVGDLPGGVTFVAADVHDLAGVPDPVGGLWRRFEANAAAPDAAAPDAAAPAADPAVPPAFDLVYALNLPAELQRPTVELAAKLDAVCAFTTLGFEEPVVDVSRKTVGSDTLYVAGGRGTDADGLDAFDSGGHDAFDPDRR